MRRTSTHTSFPGAEVASHQQIVEACHANELQELRDDLLCDRFFHVVALQALPDFVQQVEYVIHAVGRLRVGVEKAVEESATSVAGGKARQRLALDEGWNDHLRETLLCLYHPGVVNIVLEAVQIVLDNRDKTLVIGPLELSSCRIATRTNALKHVALC